MNQISTTTRTKQLADALDLMRTALDALDEAGAPLDIGAHLDLAISRLEIAVQNVREAA